MVFVVDITTLIVPVLLGFTVLVNHVKMLIVTGLSVSLGMLILCSAKRSKQQRHQHLRSIMSSSMYGKRPFIGVYRAYVVIATAIAILAVDFIIFPRRFAKAETYGSGLMDVGVGAYIISNAIVSPEARGLLSRDTGFISPVMKSLKSSFPLLVLGIARLMSVKGTDYQEHVSEYGIHWNFFFTLFFVKVFSTALVQVIPGGIWYGVSGLALTSFYQYLLSCAGLRSFVLYGRQGDGSRLGFVDANREGLCSCPGYLALYLIGVQLGKFIFQKRNTVGQWTKALFVLLTADVVFLLLVQASQHFVSPISRRMANLSFVLWQVTYNIQLLSIFLFFDILITAANSAGLLEGAALGGCHVCYPLKTWSTSTRLSQSESSRPCACLLAAINRNLLLYFLLANLLTGAVNFSIQTIFCSAVKGFLVVCSYLLVLNLLISLIHIREKTFKL